MKRLTLAHKIFCTVALLCAAAWSANAVNIVADPGFEASTGDGTPGLHPFSPAWTDNDPSGFSGVGGFAEFAHSGDNYAILGATPNTGMLFQDLTTEAGRSYTISFWLANDFTAGSNLGPFTAFEVFWGGVSIFALPDSGPVFPYTQFTFSGLLATSGTTRLEFDYRHDNDFFRLDDVSVEVPESFSTIWLALPTVGLLGVASLRRRGKGCAGA